MGNMSESEPAKKPRGTVFVRTEVCKGCSYCIDFCPTHCIEFSREFNPKGYHFPVVAEGKEDACVNCRFCRLVCREFALYTEETR